MHAYLVKFNQALIVALSCSCLFFVATTVFAMQPFRIGTAGKTGVYYPIGTLIAQSLTLQAQQQGSRLGELIGVPQNSAGSIENVKGVVAGDIEAGLVQANIASFAHNSQPPFDKTNLNTSIRAIASLYSEKFQIIVRNDAGITNFQDIKNKKISVDEQGSGTLAVMRILLDAYGMTENDFHPLYLKPVFIEDRIKSGQVQGFVNMAGAPMKAVTQLYETGISLVSIDPVVASQVHEKYPYLFPGKIEENIYNGIPETLTLEVYALLVVNESLSEEVAYAITEMLFNKQTAALLSSGHPQGRSITLETALNGISIPLHPGARKFYHNRKLIE
ncbi:MAG: TRAP transporter TAXI family solute receptor [Desulforhopalus sp.]|jgi:TRAP transporter TAXI family solute receptor